MPPGRLFSRSSIFRHRIALGVRQHPHTLVVGEIQVIRDWRMISVLMRWISRDLGHAQAVKPVRQDVWRPRRNGDVTELLILRILSPKRIIWRRSAMPSPSKSTRTYSSTSQPSNIAGSVRVWSSCHSAEGFADHAVLRFVVVQRCRCNVIFVNVVAHLTDVQRAYAWRCDRPHRGIHPAPGNRVVPARDKRFIEQDRRQLDLAGDFQQPWP